MRGPPARHPDEQREQLPAVEGIITDASELKAGDRVVYPNQGVCEITGIETQDIAGQKLELVRMRREEDGAAVMVPKGKVPAVGLRRVASGDQIEGVFHYLGAQFDDPELDWKVRHRDNADRLIAGGVLGVAEVVKGLHSLSRIRPLPTKEREQYDNARHLLVHEVSVSLAVPMVLAEDYIDYALMPPAGVKFDLKPPPAPVLLPTRPKRRRIFAEEGEGEDLGLDDLGLPEIPEIAGEGGEAAAGGEEGAEAAPAAAEKGGEEEAAEEDLPAARPARPRPGAAREEREERAAKPARAEKAAKKPAAKPPPRKAAPPRKAPAARKEKARPAPAKKAAKAAPAAKKGKKR